MSATTTNLCASTLTFILLIGSMVLPALAREEIAVLNGGGWSADISGERSAVDQKASALLSLAK